MGPLGQPEHIEDQGDLAISHDGRTGEQADPLELFLQRLDDDFLGVVDLVDDEAKLPFICLKYDDVEAAVRARRMVELELFFEIDDRQQIAAQPVDRRAVNLFDAALSILAVEANQLEQADLRDGVAIAVAGDRQGRNDRQRERDLHLDRGALAQTAIHVDTAADLLDVGADHIHADAAAGKVADPFRRRKAGYEDEVDDFAVAHARGLFGCDELDGDCLVADPDRIDAAAVIGDFDDDLAPLVEGTQAQA